MVMNMVTVIFLFEIKERQITKVYNYMLVKKQSRVAVRKY